MCVLVADCCDYLAFFCIFTFESVTSHTKCVIIVYVSLCTLAILTNVQDVYVFLVWSVQVLRVNNWACWFLAWLCYFQAFVSYFSWYLYYFLSILIGLFVCIILRPHLCFSFIHPYYVIQKCNTLLIHYFLSSLAFDGWSSMATVYSQHSTACSNFLAVRALTNHSYVTYLYSLILAFIPGSCLLAACT